MEQIAKRVAIYVRVSTQDQSCELQQRDISNYVASRGWVVECIYEDKATGTNGNRAGLKEMMVAVRRRQVDVVICWKLDRLFRSLKDIVGTLQEFNELGVEFVSLRDNVDLTTSSGRLMFHIIGAFGEFEASLIRERVRAGIKNAKEKGIRFGRPRLNMEVKIRELRAFGKSYRAIQKELNVSSGTVRRALQIAAPNTPNQNELTEQRDITETSLLRERKG